MAILNTSAKRQGGGRMVAPHDPGGGEDGGHAQGFPGACTRGTPA
jgi:hypothetical protein